MGFYEMRKYVLKGVEDYLRRAAEDKRAGYEPQLYTDIRRRIMLETGCTEQMVDGAVEALVPGATVKNGAIVKKDD